MQRFILYFPHLLFAFSLILSCFSGCTGSSEGAPPQKRADEEMIHKVQGVTEPSVSDERETEEESDGKKHIYGTSRHLPYTIEPYGEAALYLPVRREAAAVPLLLFTPGWGSRNHTDYSTVLSFLASQGYAVIYAPSPARYDALSTIAAFERVLNDSRYSDAIDRDRIGVVGHSSGGGIAFAVLSYFAQRGYGKEGKALFAIDPWFAFGMDSERFATFPSDTNLIIQQYGDSGSTDPRIALTIYAQLAAIEPQRRDYQYFGTLDHAYIFSTNTRQMQRLLRPLDALLDYTFRGRQEAFETALSVGNDAPYETGLQPVRATESYAYRCDGNGNRTLVSALNGIDYCAILP